MERNTGFTRDLHGIDPGDTAHKLSSILLFKSCLKTHPRAVSAPVAPGNICSMFRRLHEEKLEQEMEKDFSFNTLNTREKPKTTKSTAFYIFTNTANTTNSKQ